MSTLKNTAKTSVFLDVRLFMHARKIFVIYSIINIFTTGERLKVKFVLKEFFLCLNSTQSEPMYYYTSLKHVLENI